MTIYDIPTLSVDNLENVYDFELLYFLRFSFKGVYQSQEYHNFSFKDVYLLLSGDR